MMATIDEKQDIEMRIRALIMEAADLEVIIEDIDAGWELRQAAIEAREELIGMAAELRRQTRREDQ